MSVIPVYEDRRVEHPVARLLVESAVALFGAALLATALLANQRWLDRHFLPSFFITRQTYVLLETTARFALGALGVSLALVVRPRIGRVAARTPAVLLPRVLSVAIAAALALAASELVLRYAQLRPAEWLGRDQEPRRQADQRLGWTFVPLRPATAPSEDASSTTRSTRPAIACAVSTNPWIPGARPYCSQASR